MSTTINRTTLARQPLRREATLYWIHCNKCFYIYVRKQRRIFVFACHHIVCERCSPPQPTDTTDGTPTFRCPLCQKIVRACLLSNNMPPHIKELLHPQPWLGDLPSFRIARFQQKQRQHFLAGLVKTNEIIQKAAKSNQQFRNEMKKAYEEYRRIHMERIKREQRVREIIAERKQMKRERAYRSALEAAAAASKQRALLTNLTTTESGIGTGSASVSYRTQRPRYQFPANMSATPMMRFTHPFSSPYQRMPAPSTCTNVQSFSYKNHNSFQL